MSLDISVDNLSCLWVHSHCAGTVDNASGDNGLRIDTRQGLGGFIGQNGSFGRHCSYFSSHLNNCRIDYRKKSRIG